MTWSKESKQSRGYGAAWAKLRATILRRDAGLCQVCLAKGRAKPGNQVDHIVSKAQGGTDDDANLQTICRECHDDKTITEQGKKRKPRIGLDGWAVAD